VSVWRPAKLKHYAANPRLRAVDRACSAAKNLGGGDAFGGVSGVDYQFGLVDYLLVVIGGVVGDYDYCVVAADVIQRRVGHVEVVVAASAYFGEVGVVVGDRSAPFAEEFDDGQRWGLAEVVDVAFVGQAEDQDLRSFDRLGVIVQSRSDLVEDEVGHGGVDFAG
jgi:hypothetical protein